MPGTQDPQKHSRLFLAPEAVDSEGDCNEDQEDGHGDKALHPGLQVPQACKEGSRGCCSSLGHSEAAVQSRGRRASHPKGWGLC